MGAALCILLALGSVETDTQLELKRVAEKLRVDFDSGSDALSGKAKKTLDTLLPLLRKTQVPIEISGHTDNQGDAQANLALSVRRAESVRKYFISKGIPEERLVARGLGQTQPLASNATAKGRGKNRRIEFFVEGLRPKREPPARLTFLRPAVEHRPAATPTFLPAQRGQDLFNYDEVATLESAAAEITFVDSSYLRLRDNALVVISGTAPRIEKEAPKKDLELVKGEGEFSFSLRPGVVSMPAAEVTARSKDFVLEVDEKKQSKVSVRDGEVQVAAQGKTVTVVEGQGTQVKPGKPPEPPRPLPVPTKLLASGPLARWYDSARPPLQVAWEKRLEAARYQVELAADARFSARVLLLATRRTRFEVPRLKPGRYYVRVTVVDDLGLRSKASKPAVVDVYDAPHLLPFGEPLPLPEGVDVYVDGLKVDAGVTTLSWGMHILSLKPPTVPVEDAVPLQIERPVDAGAEFDEFLELPDGGLVLVDGGALSPGADEADAGGAAAEDAGVSDAGVGTNSDAGVLDAGAASTPDVPSPASR